jgi:uncharacterized glyoxalase superfamily protein PhnB/uncharacterized protein YndB with AHSA1/START domain
MKATAEQPMTVDKDVKNKKMVITRYFEAPVDLVWRAWTESEILDEWWAPKPYKTETKSQEFKVGGTWYYSMVGPGDFRHHCRADYTAIDAPKSFTWIDAFCDENGKINEDFPRTTWIITFEAIDKNSSRVVVDMVSPTGRDLDTLLEMGMEGGFKSALTNLDHYLATRFKLRKEFKFSNEPRVTTYLNFPGKTEEAFRFYKEVFNGTFSGGGLQRFGYMQMPEGHPPMTEADKNLIIHAELTIMGGHVLMATDSPESMGFKIQQGNNMHINLEPSSRKETERIFKALSEGGKVEMPLADMFWGAYFASFTDKYGINWMLNCQAKE